MNKKQQTEIIARRGPKNGKEPMIMSEHHPFRKLGSQWNTSLLYKTRDRGEEEQHHGGSTRKTICNSNK